MNIIQPGQNVSNETIAQMSSSFSDNMKSNIETAMLPNGPLQFIVDMVPDNFFKSASSNGNMLQVIFFAIFF